MAGVPSSSWLDEDAQAFDGATSVTNLGLRTEGLSHKCDLYGYTNPFASSFAYIHKDTKAFRVMTDEGLNRAMMKESWEQRGGGAFQFACFMCCGRFHGENYQRESEGTKMKLTSKWQNAAKLSKSGGGSKKINRAVEALENGEKRRRDASSTAVQPADEGISLRQAIDGYNNALIAKGP